ncbi:MAG: DUF192 domain-containing protein [Rhodospirillaceae bacterium]
METERGRQAFQVEIARTPREHELGLMFRRSLAKNSGMLFQYAYPSIIRMWMKNTFIPLDMIFISEEGYVVRVFERAVPGSLQIISSEKPVKAVLEVNGGTVSRIGLKIGDRIYHPFFKVGD